MPRHPTTLLDRFHDDRAADQRWKGVQRFQRRAVVIQRPFPCPLPVHLRHHQPAAGPDEGREKRCGPLDPVDVEPAGAEACAHREIIDVIQRDRADVSGDACDVVRGDWQCIEKRPGTREKKRNRPFALRMFGVVMNARPPGRVMRATSRMK